MFVRVYQTHFVNTNEQQNLKQRVMQQGIG